MSLRCSKSGGFKMTQVPRNSPFHTLPSIRTPIRMLIDVSGRDLPKESCLVYNHNQTEVGESWRLTKSVEESSGQLRNAWKPFPEERIDFIVLSRDRSFIVPSFCPSLLSSTNLCIPGGRMTRTLLWRRFATTPSSPTTASLWKMPLLPSVS